MTADLDFPPIPRVGDKLAPTGYELRRRDVFRHIALIERRNHDLIDPRRG